MNLLPKSVAISQKFFLKLEHLSVRSDAFTTSWIVKKQKYGFIPFKYRESAELFLQVAEQVHLSLYSN